MKFYPNPKFKLTLGTQEFESELLTSAKVIRRENGWDIATIEIDNEANPYPELVNNKTAIQLEVTNEGYSYPTNPMFKGVIRFPVVDIKPKTQKVALSCLGSGYGFGQMLVANEYGSTSNNPTQDTIAEIFSQIRSEYVNKVLGSGASGFSYTEDLDTDLTDVIRYCEFPFKYADKCLNDIIDLYTAVRAGSSGAHWIVTTDDVLRMQAVDGTSTDWTKYYGNSAANATLTYGEDFEEYNLEPQTEEYNHITYYGVFRRPGNGDAWTEASTDGWGSSGITLSSDGTYYCIGAASLRLTADDTALNEAYYPSTQDAAWNFNEMGSAQYPPTLNFKLSKHQAVSNFLIEVHTDSTHAYSTQQIGFGTSFLDSNDTFVEFSIPVGQNWTSAPNLNKIRWTALANPADWAEINWIKLSFTANSAGDFMNIDGLYFGDFPICRVAKNSDYSPYSMKLIVDDVGKDDSLNTADDSGMMAQLAYAELLRSQKTTYQITTKQQILPDALPGQWFSISSVDLRAREITHVINGDDFTTYLDLTSDVVNGNTRRRYEDINKQYAALRPENQDRQATNIKAGKVDWRIPRYEVDYHA
jgi:hypothetical protein